MVCLIARAGIFNPLALARSYRCRSWRVPRHMCSSGGTDGNDGRDGDEVEAEVVSREKSDPSNDTPPSGIAPKTVPAIFPEVTMIPLSRNPVFPKFMKLVEFNDEKLMTELQMIMDSGQPYAGAFLRRNEDYDDDAELVSDLSEVEPMGCFVEIRGVDVNTTEDGKTRMRAVLLGHRRIAITGLVNSDDCRDFEDGENNGDNDEEGSPPRVMKVTVENATDKPYDRNDEVVKAYSTEILKTIRDIVKFSELYKESVQHVMQMGHKVYDNPANLADFGAALTSAEPQELQNVMKELNIPARLEFSLELLKKELLQTKLQNQISKEVEEKISKSQREHLLREQMNVIKKELGITKDDKDSLAEKFKALLKDVKLSDDVQKVVDENLSKLSFLDSNSPEFNVTRNYLEWLTGVPWGRTTEENFDIPSATDILDEDHFGMKDVKDRILEFIAVGSLVGSTQGKILCFIGPPGVGKTSIAKSIAKALNREYFRFSVGGLFDVAEIKGHRRTYVGAMPGKPIQCLKKVGSENPLILIDEIDKIGRGTQGDPTSALLELLDPEQNKYFTDHYLDVPVDMSKVLFLCTANVEDTIPGPLKDRMEVVHLSGYIAEEKVQIAEKYLIPGAQLTSGVGKDDLEFEEGAIQTLIRSYCRESGVRNLQKQIEKIFRKAALKIVQRKSSSVECEAEEVEPLPVTSDNLKDYVGNAVFTSDRMYDETPAGVVMGLAWTAMGGSSLYIETLVAEPATNNNESSKSTPGLQVTGQLGDVMKESSTISYTYAKHFLGKKEPDNSFFSTASISLHVPEGAVPKDGPSAGCTITTALLSLAMDKPLKKDLAMTGEISLTGKVLPVGGIKEKVLAAKRAGVQTVIMPKQNQKDWDDLSDEIREGVDACFAEKYEEVFEAAFGEQNAS